MKTNTTPYMLIFRDTNTPEYQAMSDEQKQHALEKWNGWFDRLAAEGKLSDGRPLEHTGRIVSNKGGRIVDGPFAESKESIGGYFMLHVSGIDEATEIARECPGLSFGLVVEVRPVAEVCPALKTEGATMSRVEAR